ncbi:MAG: phosphoribosyltransferase, partial [Proteobacteria bacterium]|nr:phosphoribosyltransferase [Pseudomonadota bacterium]
RYMKTGQVYNQSRRLEFETRVKEQLKSYITSSLPGETVVLAVAPGHEAYNYSSFMYNLVGQFILENCQQLNLEDGRNLLERSKTIEKQATAGAYRNESTHRESISLNLHCPPPPPPRLPNEGKVVVILDDVWTSGCTLRVCEEKVRTTSPKDVRLVAIGKTVPHQ